jgi:hypothetical protein
VIINSESKRCHRTNGCDVGLVSLSQDSDTPHFIKGLFHPLRSELPMDDVWFTQLGQNPLAEAAIGFDHDSSVAEPEVA